MAKDEDVNVNLKTKGADQLAEDLKKSEEAAAGLADEFGLMDTQAGRVFKTVTQGAQKGIAAMKTLRGAVLATGIGALAIAVLSLVSYFTKTEEGAQKLRKAMAFLGAILDKIRDVFVGLGKRLTEVKFSFESLGDLLKKGFQAIVQNIVNRFVALLDIAKAIGKLFKGDFKEGLKDLADGTIKLTTGIDDMSGKLEKARDKFKAFTAEVSAAAKAAADLADRQNKLKVSQRDFLVEQAKLEVQLSEARLKTNDATLSTEERIKALNEAQAIQNEISNEQLRLAKEAYEIKKAQNALASSTEEDLDEEANLLANLIRVEKERNDKSKEFSDQRSALQKAEADKVEAARLKKEADDAETEKKNEELAAAEVERARSVLEKITALEEEAAKTKQQREDEAYLAAIENEEEREAARIELQAQRREEQLELEDEQFEEDLARALEKKEIMESEVQGVRDAYNELRLEKQADIDAQEVKAEEELAKKRLEMEKVVQQQKIDGALAAAGALIGASKAIFGDTKASAIAETIISTYQSATSAFKSLAGIPIVGPALGAIAAAAAVAGGIANLAKIKGSNKKETAPPKDVVLPNKNPFQEGGYITGLPHSQGGTTITAESGEYVSSRRTMASAFGPVIETLNKMGNSGMAGGSMISEERVAQIAAETVKAVPVYVVETNITNKQREVSVRESAYVK